MSRSGRKRLSALLHGHARAARHNIGDGEAAKVITGLILDEYADGTDEAFMGGLFFGALGTLLALVVLCLSLEWVAS